MKLIMTGLDWHKAPIDLREQLSFPRNQVLQLDRRLSRRGGVEGCVLLSTSHRTERCLSAGELQLGAVAGGQQHAALPPAPARPGAGQLQPLAPV